MFNVINADSGEVIVTFDDGATAGRYVAESNSLFARAGTAVRYRIVRQTVAEISDEWKAREQARFANGTYKTVPWFNEDWNNQNHFCHVSNEDSEKIAYTATAADGATDKQTRTRPGRYLEQHYGNVLSQDEIRDWCARFTLENNKPKLLFATGQGGIEYVYLNGPSSCMSKTLDWYESPVHPVRTYGTDDWAIAYMKNPNGEISARVMVAPDRKVYSRIYGDYSRLRVLLEEAGYSCGNDEEDWEGLRLLRIEADNGFVAPYLDSPMSNVRDNGKFLIVDCNGAIECHETNGTANEGEMCACCEDRCGGEMYTVGGETWCQDCYESYSAYCSGCDESYHCDDMAGSNRHGDSFCRSCASSMSECEHCGHLDDDTVETLENETWCQHCAEDHLEMTACDTFARNPENCECEVCEETRNQGELEV